MRKWKQRMATSLIVAMTAGMIPAQAFAEANYRPYKWEYFSGGGGR